MPTIDRSRRFDPVVPDYDVEDYVLADRPDQLKALADRTRVTILGMLGERATTTTQLAEALGRPKGTIGYHLKVLEDAGLARVVRTRKVRALTEKYYGRTGRTIVYGGPREAKDPFAFLKEAMQEAVLEADRVLPMWTIRRARVPEARAEEFAGRVAALAEEFVGQPRSGDTVYGFVAGVYRTNHPALPPAEGEVGP